MCTSLNSAPGGSEEIYLLGCWTDAQEEMTEQNGNAFKFVTSNCNFDPIQASAYSLTFLLLPADDEDTAVANLPVLSTQPFSTSAALLAELPI